MRGGKVRWRLHFGLLGAVTLWAALFAFAFSGTHDAATLPFAIEGLIAAAAFGGAQALFTTILVPLLGHSSSRVVAIHAACLGAFVGSVLIFVPDVRPPVSQLARDWRRALHRDRATMALQRCVRVQRWAFDGGVLRVGGVVPSDSEAVVTFAQIGGDFLSGPRGSKVRVEPVADGAGSLTWEVPVSREGSAGTRRDDALVEFSCSVSGAPVAGEVTFSTMQSLPYAGTNSAGVPYVRFPLRAK